MSADRNQLLRALRPIVRRASLVAAVLVLILARRTHWPVIVAGLSPFVAIASILAGGAIWTVAPLGLLVLAIVATRRRWFCRWLCPMGVLADGSSYLGRLAKRKPRKLPSIGQWILWITLASAVLGYPVLLWLDPLTLFSGAFSVTRPAAWYGILPAIAVLLLSFLIPGAWCARVCPLGGLQEFAAELVKRLRHLLTRQPSEDSGRPLARRTVLGVLVGAGTTSAIQAASGQTSKPIRLPGAAEEMEFRGLCVRCGNCIRACPTHVIEPDLGRHGITSLLTPTVSFEDGYCKEDCARCTTVCPSGALKPLKVEAKSKVFMGLARVDMDICLLGEDRDCSACRNWCPYQAVHHIFSEESYTLTPVIDAQKCTGCGACQMVCPTSPKKAITIAPL